jgi:hypothetical protein
VAAAGSAGHTEPMLWTIFVILLILWALGIVSAYTLHGTSTSCRSSRSRSC